MSCVITKFIHKKFGLQRDLCKIGNLDKLLAYAYLEEDSVAPQVISQRGELMVLPLTERPRSQAHLAGRPTFCLE